MPLQQTTFVNFVANGEIAHIEHFLNLPECYHHPLFNNYNYYNSLYRDFSYFCWYVFKSSAADLLYVRKRLISTCAFILTYPNAHKNSEIS